MVSIENPPGWAFSWCWYFFLNSAISGITAILTLVTLITMYKYLMKNKTFGLLSVYVLVLVMQSITSMVTFWMCRSSLKPKSENFVGNSKSVKNPLLGV